MTGAAVAGADGAACSATLHYRMRIGGVDIARLVIRDKRLDAGRQRLELDMRNAGWTTLFGSVRTHMKGVVRSSEDRILPDDFRVVYRKPDRTRRIRLLYDETGRLKDVHLRTNGRPKKSAVPEELQGGTVDPLTAYARIRAWLESSPKVGDRLRIAVFEGRKRLDLEAIYEGEEARKVGGETLPFHHLRVRLVGRFGFDDGFGFVGRPDEPPNWLDVWVTADRCPTLVQASGTSGVGAPVIERD